MDSIKTIPAVMFIEMASDQLKSRLSNESEAIQKEMKEFDALGHGGKADVESMFPVETDPLLIGYLLGLETARILLSTQVDAVKANVNI